VATSRISQSPIVRFRNLAEHLGPVKAASYRQASRIANTLRAGYPVHRYEDLSRSRIVLVHDSGEKAAPVLSQMAAAGLDWSEKVVLICGESFTSEDLSELAAKGAAVGSLTAIDGPGELRFLVEGDRLAVRGAKKLVEVGGGRVLEIRQCTQRVCAAGASFASWLLVPLIDASVECFRAAGLTPGRAGPIVERIVERSLRAYLKGGRRSWKEPRSAEQRRAILRQVESLRKTDSELASFLLDTARVSLSHLGRDAGWLQDATPPLRRAAAASGM
jgi:predicted short-subunit dehydrogenase-like oxidoreductase (DUF2520 family)